MQTVSLIRFSLAAVGSVLAVAASAPASHAGNFTTTYDFTSSTTVTNPPGVSFSSFGNGSGVGSINTSGVYSAGINWTIATTPDAADYFQFTVKALPGNSLSLSNLSFKLQREGNGPQNWRLGYAVAGSVPGETSVFANLLGSAGSFSANSATGNFNLSGESTLQNVAAAQTVIFRLYGYNATAINGQRGLSIDDVTVSGAIPTPAALPAIVGFGVSLWRKRKEQTV